MKTFQVLSSSDRKDSLDSCVSSTHPSSNFLDPKLLPQHPSAAGNPHKWTIVRRNTEMGPTLNCKPTKSFFARYSECPLI